MTENFRPSAIRGVEVIDGAAILDPLLIFLAVLLDLLGFQQIGGDALTRNPDLLPPPADHRFELLGGTGCEALGPGGQLLVNAGIGERGLATGSRSAPVDRRC